MKNRKPLIILVVVIVLALILWSFLGQKEGKSVTVGAKDFTEQYILGSMISTLLRENGFQVEEKFGTGSTITREGLATGQSDLYPEYTGTAWAVYLNHADVKVNDPVELYNQVKAEDAANGIVWLDPAPLNNTYALAIKAENVTKYGDSLEALADYVNTHPGELIFGIDHEFYERADGFWMMAEEYGMKVQENQVKKMDIGLSFESIDRDQIDVAMVFATDGKLKKYNLKVLTDTQNFFPVYNMSVCVNQETLEKYPEIEEILSPLTDLDDETMQALNYQVDAEETPAEVVARDYLKEKGLIN